MAMERTLAWAEIVAVGNSKCNSTVVFIVRSMVTASREMMPELRLLQSVIVRRELELDPRWIHSAENIYADHFSRSRDSSAPQVSRFIVGMLAKSLGSVVGEGTVFFYRLCDGENPVSQRNKADAALDEYWGGGNDIKGLRALSSTTCKCPRGKHNPTTGPQRDGGASPTSDPQ